MPTPPPRPVFLNLLQIRLPVAALLSILHRLTGVLMVLLIPFSAFLLERSLSGEEGFTAIVQWLHTTPARLVLFLLSWTLLHHLLAGLRYLLIDLECGVTRPAYRYTAWVVLWLAPLLALLVSRGLA